MNIINIYQFPSLLIGCLLIMFHSGAYAENKSTMISAKEVAESDAFFYLGAKLGVNHYQNGCQPWNVSCDKTDEAGGVYGGYQFNQYFALEAAYLHLGDAVAVYPVNGLNQTYTGTMQGLELSALGLLPITDRFSLFAKGGVYNWHATNDGPHQRIKESGLSPTAGLGLSYQLSISWQARLEYQYFYELGNEEVGGSHGQLTTLGIAYQFGRIKPTPVVQNIYMPVQLETFSFAIIFDFAKSEVLLKNDLQQVVTRLNKHPQATVELTGYADAKGTEAFNLTLSKARVKHVSDYLIEQGVKAEQITEHHLGEAEPVIGNDTDEHRHLNRHVQVLLPAVTIYPTLEAQ